MIIRRKKKVREVIYRSFVTFVTVYSFMYALPWIPMQIGISSVGDEKQLRNWKRHFGATWIFRVSLYTMWASGCGNGLLWINLIASLLFFSGYFATSSCSFTESLWAKTKGKNMKNFRFINCINLTVLWNDPFLTLSYRTIYLVLL